MGSMTIPHSVQNAGDVTLASGLIASPAWVPWLDGINSILTLVTLALGLCLGAIRLWIVIRDDRKRRKDSE